MCAVRKLPSEELEKRCNPAELPFETTAFVEPFSGLLGQERALSALRFGLGMRRHGYHLFAVGPHGVGKQTLLRQVLGDQAQQEQTPADACYVHNFATPSRPRLLSLPPGVGAAFAAAMASAVAELRVAMRSAFESEERRTRRQQAVARFMERQQRALGAVRERAQAKNVAVLQTEQGITIAPLVGDSLLEPDKFGELPQAEQEQRQADMERVGEELHELLREFHEWGREHLEALKALDREIATTVTRRVLDTVRAQYRELPAVLTHLADVEIDVIDSAEAFLDASKDGLEVTLQRALKHGENDATPFRRYGVNVLVTGAADRGAPVVYEDNPTYGNLVGRVEHETQFGALITNFTLIKPGAFHRAVGGYLVLDALKVLDHPLAWEAVKRTIRADEIRIESLGQSLGLLSTVSLDPEQMPLGRTKVILLGERFLYYLLAARDPEFLELFKVLVDFEDRTDREPTTEARYASMIATLVNKEGLRPFDRGAVARAIDHAARLAGDAHKLSVHMRAVVDLLREADFWAGEAKQDVVGAAHVEAAVAAQLERGGRLRERLHDAIERGDIVIDSAGERVGQVNGLSVFQLGEQLSGHPIRITAQVRMGKGEVIDIEREVELGGPIHSKGVLIVAGLLGARYAQQKPLSLSATLVVEQSYGAVEGDSASLAELCALLSALSELPAKQSLAVTGAVSQHGQVQSIGGVNEKIEGFFDVCRARGHGGEQGVIIPSSNVKNLMLRSDVVQAVAEGRFAVYAVDDVDDALSLLLGRPAGVRGPDGRFAEGTANAAVEARLSAFAEAARAFLAKPKDGS